MDPWIGKIPWGRAWPPTPVSHGLRILTGGKESDMTEQLSPHACWGRMARSKNLRMASGHEIGPMLTYKEMGASAMQLQGSEFIFTICKPRIRAELPLSSQTQPPA